MNILFIGPIFNNYEKIITDTIRKSHKYERVFFLQDCPMKSVSLYATLCRLCPPSKSYFSKKHNKNIRNLILTYNIDVLYVIKGEYLQLATLKLLKEEKPNLKIIVYQWDSIRNNPNALDIVPFSNKTYTFDYKDAEDLHITYLPLFYCWKEYGYEMKNEPNKYDMMSIGGYRNHRMPYIYIMRRLCEKHNLSTKFHNYERFGAYVLNFKKNKIKLKDVNFTSIVYKDYLSILNKSACVLDISSPKQDGLTMRTIETLSMGKKLVTTNVNIKKEPFYNSNVLVIESPEDIERLNLLEFLQTPIVENNGLLSLTEWLSKQDVL